MWNVVYGKGKRANLARAKYGSVNSGMSETIRRPECSTLCEQQCSIVIRYLL